MTDRQTRIRTALTAAFSPDILEIADDSARHAGHAGAAPTGETHFNIVISSSDLLQMSRVSAHRAVNDALKLEFENGLHALSIKIRKPAA